MPAMARCRRVAGLLIPGHNATEGLFCCILPRPPVESAPLGNPLLRTICCVMLHLWTRFSYRHNELVLKELMTGPDTFSELFSLLPARENPKHAMVGGRSYIIHEDHRWLLPIANFAQEMNLIPKPCTLVMFDAHKDSVDPTCLEVLSAARASLTSQQLVDICQTQLRILDDDWVKAGIELGIFGDAVVFGGWRGEELHDVDVYQDKATSQNHRFIKSGLPLHALAYQGELSDRAVRPVYAGDNEGNYTCPLR
jgi:hypothetical protein